MLSVKLISFLGDSLDRFRDFPDNRRSEAGHQLNEIQIANNPNDW
jgi:phage-related protein